MIQLHIISNTKKQAREVADWLIYERLAVSATMVQEVITHKSDAEGKAGVFDQFLLLAKTRASLFSEIDRLLREKYPDELPSIYAVPIVAMDWEQANHLREATIDPESEKNIS
jgi:uncharacterized protein involved in tolerance to divalent cations